jgi:hypothetical protein
MKNIQDVQQLTVLMAQLGRTCAHGSTQNDRTFNWTRKHYHPRRPQQAKGSAK